MAHDNAGPRFRLEGNHVAHTHAEVDTCAATRRHAALAQTAKFAAVPPLTPSATLLVPVLLSSSFLSFPVSSHCRTCICLFAWPSEPGTEGKKKLAGVFKPPHLLPPGTTCHLCGEGVSLLDSLGGLSGRDNKTGLRTGMESLAPL